MQNDSDLDVRRLAARMGAALPAYRSFRNSPTWAAPAVQPPVAAEAEAAPVETDVTAAPAQPVVPAAPSEAGFAALRGLMAAAPPPDAPHAASGAPPAGGFPLIEAALATRPAVPAAEGSTLAALRGRLADASRPMGH